MAPDGLCSADLAGPLRNAPLRVIFLDPLLSRPSFRPGPLDPSEFAIRFIAIIRLAR